MEKLILMSLLATTRLNPCSCGGWSQSIIMFNLDEIKTSVLILVLVEDGLREYKLVAKDITKCLNPCSCGGWSQRLVALQETADEVLILVLVEDGLRASQRTPK